VWRERNVIGQAEFKDEDDTTTTAKNSCEASQCFRIFDFLMNALLALTERGAP
jgi:hypothetical protein